MEVKILNLYAGIGGNRLYWDDVADIKVTAVEINQEIADIYQNRFKNDTVIVGDAKQYLLDHYQEFDFIWVSPPCQTHTATRHCRVGKSLGAVYADMSLWQIISFLQYHGNAHFVVENVVPYYPPMIRPTIQIDRHLYWANFEISEISVVKDKIIEKIKVSDFDIDLSGYSGRKDQIIRNQVNYETGKHILQCALNKIEHKKGGLF